MRDLMFVLLAVGFFGVAAAYVRACGAVVGPEVAETDVGETDGVDEATDLPAWSADPA